MSYEDQIISLINKSMPKSALRKSISGEVDAEVIILGDKEYLFTTDDFSPEDLLQEADPYVLGWNLACGAISDIIAAGGKPLVYAHSMVIPKAWDKTYIKQFSNGISSILKKYSVSFMGGDIGVADRWRYTASVIGEPIGRIVNRKGCQAGDSIFLTGKIGAGNLDAVLNLYSGNENLDKLRKGTKNKFNTHEQLPGIISRYASCAIDTSDGVFASLKILSDLNRTGFQISNLRFNSKAMLAAKLLQVPELLFLLGECGEYEILFTVMEYDREVLTAEMDELGIDAFELGKITNNKQRTVVYKNNLYDFAGYNIHARDFTDVRDYLKTMTEWVMPKGESK